MLSFRLSTLQAADWAQQAFADSPLGNRRRSRRAAQLAATLAVHPGLSIPCLFDSPYDVKAAYALLDRPEATPERLQRPHRRDVAAQLAVAGRTCLLLEDTSDLSWSGNLPISGLGPIGLGRQGQQGFQLHSVLAVVWPQLLPGQVQRPPVQILGLADQIYHVRAAAPAGKKSAACNARPAESALWSQAGGHLGPAPAGARWERVCDRGADMFPFLASCRQLGHGFIVRAAQDRALESGGRLFQAAGQAKVLGHFELGLRSRPGQAARVVRLAVAAAPV